MKDSLNIIKYLNCTLHHKLVYHVNELVTISYHDTRILEVINMIKFTFWTLIYTWWSCHKLENKE